MTKFYPIFGLMLLFIFSERAYSKPPVAIKEEVEEIVEDADEEVEAEVIEEAPVIVKESFKKADPKSRVSPEAVAKETATQEAVAKEAAVPPTDAETDLDEAISDEPVKQTNKKATKETAAKEAAIPETDAETPMDQAISDAPVKQTNKKATKETAAKETAIPATDAETAMDQAISDAPVKQTNKKATKSAAATEAAVAGAAATGAAVTEAAVAGAAATGAAVTGAAAKGSAVKGAAAKGTTAKGVAATEAAVAGAAVAGAAATGAAITEAAVEGAAATGTAVTEAAVEGAAVAAAVKETPTKGKGKSAAKPVSEFVFEKGYPTEETIQKAYDIADMNRALQAYRFFYPTVSMMGAYKTNIQSGLVANRIFGYMEGSPENFMFTPVADLHYAGIPLDLSKGPFVIEIPAGPIMGVVNDLNQRSVLEVGLTGPDKGKGGKHIILPPNHKGNLPAGFYSGTSSTTHVLIVLRANAAEGGNAAIERLLKSVRVYPLNPPANWTEPKWTMIKEMDSNNLPRVWEDNMKYWELLHEFLNSEPAYSMHRPLYGELAELGIEKGHKFVPNERMKLILEHAARTGSALMRVQAFADRRSERIVWKDRMWEWSTPPIASGTFETASYTDLYAREKWFFQAQLASPSMFERAPGAESVFWMGLRDKSGTYLDGGKTYKLTVSQPVPTGSSWSITLYDNDTRTELNTDETMAMLRSSVELRGLAKEKSLTLYFGPEAPAGFEDQWVKTMPGKGWFSYFRIFNPENQALDGSWRLSDFEELKPKFISEQRN